MRQETRAHLGKQGAEIASVRGTLQALAESWGNDYEHVKYLQRRISDMEEKLSNIQNTLHEIEWSEDIDWLAEPEPPTKEEVIKSLRKRGIDERSIMGEDEIALAKRKRDEWLEDKAGIDA